MNEEAFSFHYDSGELKASSSNICSLGGACRLIRCTTSFYPHQNHIHLNFSLFQYFASLQDKQIKRRTVWLF
jgi:hypothetical protein